MFKPLRAAFLALISTAFSVTALAAEPNIDLLKKALGGATPNSIAETAVPGMYEVTMESQIVYISEDGRYIMQGELVDLATAVNLTEQKRKSLRLAAISEIGNDQTVVFAPAGETKHTVTVFTDIDCGYCRKLHKEMSQYNDAGIAIRYMAFPRAGLKSESYNKAVSVWCADDQQDAMTKSKNGQAVAEKSCENPVADQYNLGIKLGVRGTPSMITSTGEMVPGYVPAQRLSQMLNAN